jgi:hypothetical protein
MDKAATNSETWDSVPSLSGGTAIIRQRCRQALGDFFRAFVKDDPWWVSLSHPVQNDEYTCLSYLLGLKHSVGIEFLHSQDIKLEKDSIATDDLVLTYGLSAQEDNGFSLRQSYEERYPQDSVILLTIPHFNLFITGDLAYYADVLGMPNSSSYWCPWCLLSRPEWQQSADATGEARTTAFLEEMSTAIQNDHAK